MTGAEILIQVLADQGVDVAFGYSGGAILPVFDAIFRYNEKAKDNKINLVVPANEQGAGFMAAGYSRATGKVGVSLVTSGPAATNAVTPVRDCTADSIPLVVVCGQVPRASMGTDAFQEAPVFNIMSACAKHCFLISDPDKLEDTVRSAFEIAASGRPGPVVIDLPKDVQNWECTFKGEGKLHFRGYEARKAKMENASMPKETAEHFFQMLGQSEHPLIYAGGGVINSNAAEELRAFSKKFGIPVVNTLMGIGSMDLHDPLALHMLGMHGTAYANYAVEDCDLLISVGARFDDRVAGKVEEFAPNAKHICHLDIDAAEIGKVKAIDWSYVSDAKKGLNELLQFGKDFKKDFSVWQKHIIELKETHGLEYDRDSKTIQPYFVIETLSDLTDGEAIICTGVGQHQMWAAQYYKYRHPRHWLTSGSMGTMGFGLPAAIGAKFGCPDKLVIDIDGDGSIRMNLGEMETATNYGVDVKILLLNNKGDGMVRQWQQMMFGARLSGTDKTLHKKDFVKAAQADGYEFAERISEKDQLRDTLKRFIEFDGPAFLEVYVDMDAHVLPMVGPGKNYREMLTGDWIKSRQESEFKEEMGKVKADLF